jgi:lipid-A-disaccharide synthase
VQLEVIRRLHQQYPKIRFLVAAYREKQRDWCQREMSESDRSLPIDFYVGKTSEIIEVSDFALMVSGSVSLELMARGTPALVIYRPSRLTYMIGKSLASCRYISLPNLIADKEIMHEMISVGSPERAISALVEQSKKLIEDSSYRAAKKQELLDLNARFAQPGATIKAATFIAQSIKQQESVQAVEKAA